MSRFSKFCEIFTLTAYLLNRIKGQDGILMVEACLDRAIHPLLN